MKQTWTLKQKLGLLFGIPIAVSFVGLCQLPTAAAASYDYFPQARIYPGAGYNPFRPSDAFRVCVDHDGNVPADGTQAVDTSVSIELLKSREDFYNKVHFSASLAGSYKFYSGGGSVRIDNEDMFHSDSLTWIVLFKTDYGRFVLKNSRLKTEFVGLQEADLYKSCGSEIVTESRKMVMAYALLTVKNLSESQKREFEAKFSFSASAGIWDASMNANYYSLLKTAKDTSQISVQIRAFGGNGLVDLADLIGGGEGRFVNYDKIPNILNHYLRGMTAANAPSIQYWTSHISAFRPNLPVRFQNFQTGQVEQMYNTYLSLSDSYKRMMQIISGDNTTQYIITPEIELTLNERADQYRVAMNQIYEAAKVCFNSDRPECKIPKLELKKVAWPKANPIYYCEQAREKAFRNNLVSYEMYQMAKNRNFGPIISFEPNGPVADEWIPCSEYLN